MAAQFAHLYSERNRIQQPDGFLVLAVFAVGVSRPANCNIVHLGDFYNTRLLWRHIELFIFLFEIKRHILNLLPLNALRQLHFIHERLGYL